jgi:uncharacterized caspase-like protein
VRYALLLLISLFLCGAAEPAAAAKRVALVIGISKYQQVPVLANPDRDADAVSALLKKSGFDVVRDQRDLGITELRRAVRDFSEVASDADIAVVYYAGHGIEVDGVNYLVPADARLLSDFDIEDETMSLERVLKALDRVRRLKLVILDACRDNPLAATMKRSVANRSIGRGLARIEPTASDTLVAFAAKAGAVASDGSGQNSPFATALVKYIAEPGLDLRLAFGRVRDDVLKMTGNRQEPFVYGSLGGENMSLVPAAPAVPKVDPDAQARVDYELAAQIGTRQAWESFLVAHATGFYADLARAQTSKLMAAEQSQAKADDARREAEQQAAQKTDELRRQLEEQNARQVSEAKKKLSEQAKKDLDEARRQVAEQTQKELEEAKHQAEIAQAQAEEARRQIEEAKKQAVVEAQAHVEQAKLDQAKAEQVKAEQAKAEQVKAEQAKAEQAKAEPATKDAKPELQQQASLTPDQAPKDVAAPAQPQIDPADIARLLQAHLKRVGCNTGNVEGNWNADSRHALELFNKNAHTELNVQVASLDALDAVRAKTDRVCPLICGKGLRVDGDRCVAITCGSGSFLNSSGECEKKREPAPKARVEARQERQESAAPRRAGGGGKCFSFGGKTYCE